VSRIIASSLNASNQSKHLLAIGDSSAILALHLAAYFSEDESLLSLLIREFPPALCSKVRCADGQVRTPLGIALKDANGRKGHDNVVALLTSATNAFESCDTLALTKLVGKSMARQASLDARYNYLLCLEEGEPSSSSTSALAVVPEKKKRKREGTKLLDTRVAQHYYNRCTDVWSIILAFAF
jgi:hypothetical protein